MDSLEEDLRRLDLLKSSKSDIEREIWALEAKIEKLKSDHHERKKLDADHDNAGDDDDKSAEEKYRIVRSIGEEYIEEDELMRLFKKKAHPVCYDGFEPSGRMHIAQGIVKAINVRKLTSAGCKVKILIADEFAFLNKKLGGDKSKIHVCGLYFIEIWKALGIGNGMVEFLWSSEEIYGQRSSEYWNLVTDISNETTVDRIKRCCQIMGRSEKDKLTCSQIRYAVMQCADVFFLEADICQMGMDQRKVNMLARETCGKIKFTEDKYKKREKPIILSHHMISGLKEGQQKMSKSDPESSIFMEDEEAVVKTKIQKAFCKPGAVEGNPCLEYIKYIVLPWFQEFSVRRKDGGSKTYTSFEELAKDFGDESLHPADLKPALAEALNRILQPVRDHFRNDDSARKLLETVKGYSITK